MNKGIYITQLKYVKEILKTFGMQDLRPIKTRMATRHKLSKNDDSTYVNQTLYRSMIWKLQYVAHNRPNITLAIGIVARFFENLKENHMMVVKIVLRYLKGNYKKNDKFQVKYIHMSNGKKILMT